MNRKLIAACLISLAVVCYQAQAATITVTITNDSGGGSLRAAIMAANTSVGVPDTIVFAIGSGQKTITLATALPMITDAATIDGYTQPGSSSNTLANADNAVLNIRIVGSIIDFEAPNCTVRGIVIGGPGAPITVGNTAPGCVVEGNFIGFNFDGVTPDPGNNEGIAINSSNNRIGGTSPGARNVIGNRAPGIEIVENPGHAASNNVVQGNFVGVDVTGVNPAPNVNSGVQISMAGTNTVGGTVPGAGNIVANSGGHGIALFTSCKALGNSTYNNGFEGIYNPVAVVTPPVLLAATNNATSTMIGVMLANTNIVTYRLEFFSGPARNPVGDGKTLIGTTNVAGNTAFTIVFPRVASSLFLTATATGPDTSQYSDTIRIITPPGGATDSWTNSVSGKWEGDSSWSLGAAPSTNQAATLVTNAVTKTVTIDGTTALDFTGTMSISNLTVGAPTGTTNTLVVANASAFAPLHVFRSLIVTNGGALTLSNSILQVDGLGANAADFEGPVTFNGGTLITSNASGLFIGNVGQGSLGLSNATGTLGYTVVGGFDPGSQGTVSMAGATTTLYALMEVADNATSTGTLWLANSFLDIQGPVYLGFEGTGNMTASNSTVYLGVDMASQPGSHATYTSVNTTNVFTELLIGEDGSASVTLIGGEMIETNSPINVGLFGTGQLSVSNTVLLTPSIILGDFPGSTGQFTFAGGNMVLSNLVITGSAAGVQSTLLVTGGQLVFTNAPTLISTSSLSQVTLSNGTLQVGALTAIPSATAGTLTVAGGNLNIGGDLNCIGPGTALWLTGGQVNAPSGTDFVGQIAISNGTFTAYDFFIGNSGAGTVTIAGGALALTGNGNGLVVGYDGSSASTLWLTGGKILAPNNLIWIGGLNTPAVGSLIASNGTTQALFAFLATDSGGAGTFTIAGGTHSIYTRLTLGGSYCTGGTGTVTVTGGQLFVTNAAHNAVLDVENGTLSVNGGYVQADIIVLSNSCAHYVYSSGQIVYGSAKLNPNRDDDGDGIPNGYEISHGLNALDPINATKDTDGDGMSDLAEYIAGTDPTNSASVFHITSVVPTNNNMRITWTTVGGHTNRVNVDTGATNGSYDGVFGNLSPLIIIPGTGPSTTNYIDVGGATNVPARYYRVRLIP